MIGEKFTVPITELIFIGMKKRIGKQLIVLIANLSGYSV